MNGESGSRVGIGTFVAWAAVRWWSVWQRRVVVIEVDVVMETKGLILDVACRKGFRAGE